MPGPRALTRPELVADGVVHGIGVVVGGSAAIGLVANAAFHGGMAETVAVAIYAIGLVAMLGCSAAYSLTGRRAFVLRQMDHAAIFAMIAGTYTPFMTLRLALPWSAVLTAIVWAAAGAGIVFKLFGSNRFSSWSTALYLALGWSVVAAIGPFVEALKPSTLVMLATGGVLYTIGVIFYASERLRFGRAIWHSFVLVAAGTQYLAVVTEIFPR